MQTHVRLARRIHITDKHFTTIGPSRPARPRAPAREGDPILSKTACLLKVSLASLTFVVFAACGPGSMPTSSSDPAASSVAIPSPAPTGQSAASDDSSLAALSPSPGAVTEAEAIALARLELERPDDAELWQTEHGPIGEIFDRISHRPSYGREQPPPSDPARLVWGVQFAMDIEVCGPEGAGCETRRALVTVFLDSSTGEWVRTTTYGPPDGQPLPSPPEA